MDCPLPAPLREDLRLHAAAAEADGSPAWVIEDPVVNRFYRIGWLEFECLLRWGEAPALVATHFGVRVAHMGVAFVVLWPMLYTDTGESWKLQKRSQRLAVASAGILAELTLAGLATLLWSLAEAGALRSAAFYLATTSWTLSLALNASPFMRFDGYFILSDLLDLPNLHERSGALARAALRRTLFAWNEPDREFFPPWQRRALVGFAFATWLYRLAVFLGIALLVYFFFFKLLGILLFAVEISWFIARPLWSELRVWRQRWSETPRHRRFFWQCVLVLLALLLVVPWPHDVHGPGLLRPLRQERVFAPFPARIAFVRAAGAIATGDELVRLDSPDLHDQGQQASVSIAALGARLSGIETVEGGLAQRNATLERLSEHVARHQSVDDELERLRIRAGFAGHWLDVDPLAGIGSWAGTQKPIGVLIDPAVWIVDAYVTQAAIERLRVGAGARFFPEHQHSALPGQVIEIDTVRSQHLPHAMLGNRQSGPVATVSGGNELQAVESLYRVRVRLETAPESWREMRGSVALRGDGESLAYTFLIRSLSLLIQESGF